MTFALVVCWGSGFSGLRFIGFIKGLGFRGLGFRVLGLWSSNPYMIPCLGVVGVSG